MQEGFCVFFFWLDRIFKIDLWCLFLCGFLVAHGLGLSLATPVFSGFGIRFVRIRKRAKPLPSTIQVRCSDFRKMLQEGRKKPVVVILYSPDM